MVKAGLLKQGFYNGGFANLRKYARGEGFVDKKLKDRDRRFWGQICSRFHGQFFLETGMKDSSGTPLKGLSKECEAQGCESRSDQILLILF